MHSPSHAQRTHLRSTVQEYLVQYCTVPPSLPSLSSFVNWLRGWQGGTDAAGPCPLLLAGSIDMHSFACLFVYKLLSALHNILSITLDHLRISHRISPSHQFTIDEWPMDPHGGRVNQDGVGTLVSFLNLRGRRGILTMVAQEATSVMIVKHCKGIFGSTRQD